MSVLKTLREKISPELHHLYATAPVETPSGIECGWHAREHALHTFFVARLFGASADIRSGDYAVLSRFLPPITSLERETKHAWCSVGGVTPVDLSLTFALFGRAPQLHAAITGEGRNGDWEVRYAEDESVLDESFESGNEIVYIEKTVHADSEDALLMDPYLFLSAPLPSDTEAWPAVHGPGIYAKISLHCFRCAAGGAKSVRSRLNRADAVKWIADHYPDAETQIFEQLKS
jgi:hypothetical protein